VKNENEFNAYLSKELSKLSPGLAKLKMAEKYHIGVPDFCLWLDGRSVLFESKFVRSIDQWSDRVGLKHPFTGPQRSFLKTMIRAGVPAFGVIGVGSRKRMILVPGDELDRPQWLERELFILCNSGIAFDEVPRLVKWMFEYRAQDDRLILSQGRR